jgi:hypothetical protein
MQENVAPPPIRRIGRTERLFQSAFKSGFDQIFKGDVIIKKLKNKHQYRITFSKVYGDRFFFYQVFNKNNDSVNDQRFAAYITTKNIINEYDTYNNTSKFFNKLVFTPTTIMELSNFSRYAFVINKAYFNSHKRLVFMVSTKEINIQNISLKKLTQIPSGKFKHVRFDIDDYVPEYLDYTMKLSDFWSKLRDQCDKDQTTTYKGNPLCPIPLLAAKCSDIIIRNSKQCFFDVYQPVYDEGKIPEGFWNLFYDLYKNQKIQN